MLVLRKIGDCKQSKRCFKLLTGKCKLIKFVSHLLKKEEGVKSYVSCYSNCLRPGLFSLPELDFFHPSFSLLRDDKWIDTQVLRIHSEKKKGLLQIKRSMVVHNEQ